MKSHVLLIKVLTETTIGVIRGSLRTASLDGRPQLVRSFNRDIERVVLMSKTRGLGFFTHDLPALGAALLHSFETRTLPKVPGFKPASKGQVPAFLQELWLCIFDETGTLLADPCTNAISCIRTISDMGKSVRVACSNKVKEQTYEKYVRIDGSLRAPSSYWTDAGPHLPLRTDRELVHFHDVVANPLPLFRDEGSDLERDRELLDNLQSFADAFNSDCPKYYPSRFIAEQRVEGRSGVRHGPGAVASGSATTDKYEFNNWDPTLESVFPREDFLSESYFGESLPHPVEHIYPSRVVAVHKDAKKVRIIACEPAERMWLQQLTLSFLKRNVLPRTANQIRLDKQSLSQQAACKGSITRETATIDLSDASDRLSLWTVERMFRKYPSLLTALRAHRTPHAVVPSQGTIRLRKFASQGSAVTFPIQSLVFWMICQSVATRGDVTKLGKVHRSRVVRVYGDDMICHSDDYNTVVRLIELLELKVNSLKSYVLGHFRESCGGDYYNGREVTPIRIKSNIRANDPSSIQALLDYQNNLHVAGHWDAAEALRKHLPRRVLENTPVTYVRDEVSQSIRSFSGSTRDHQMTRWCANEQQLHYRSWGLTSESESEDRLGTSRMRMAIYEMPYLSENYSSDIPLRAKTRERLSWEGLHGIAA